MDPDANLREQHELIHATKTTATRARLYELRIALLDWMHRGGCEPAWADYDDATRLFKRWRVRYYGI